jgi:hypothetical protein
MQEMGHTDPALALAIYAQAMRRDDGENEGLRARIDGGQLSPPIEAMRHVKVDV